MSLAIKFMSCNGFCGNCYENKIRSVQKDYSIDLEKVLAVLKDEENKSVSGRSKAPCIHGGEPLLIPIDTLEILLKEIFRIWGSSGIQTNGIALSEDHIDLFKKYKTCVGLSLDGDTAELNYGRWNMKLPASVSPDKSLEHIFKMMKRMRDESVSMSIISILRQHNVVGERLSSFIKFILRMEHEFGIYSFRMNPVIPFSDGFKQEALSDIELAEAWIKLFDVCIEHDKRIWFPYRDVIELLLGHFNATCNFSGCDPWCTTAESPINEKGEVGNCLKSGGSQSGIFVVASEIKTDIRSVVLANVGQEEKGCRGCEFWRMCLGGCPGEGIDFDYRNRSRFCWAWKALFTHAKKRIKGLFPVLHTVDDYAPDLPAIGDTVASLEKTTYRNQYKKKPVKYIVKQVPKAHHIDRPHVDSDHGDSYVK